MRRAATEATRMANPFTSLPQTDTVRRPDAQRVTIAAREQGCMSRKMVHEPMPVLVIEDDAPLCHLIQTILVRGGMATQVVNRGDAGLRLIDAEGERFAAIVLDLMLPWLNGIEILERIEKTAPHLLSRVVVLTAVSSAVLETFRFEPLIWRVMRKPFDIDDFSETILACSTCHGRAGGVPGEAELNHWFDRKSTLLGASGGVAAVADGTLLKARATFGGVAPFAGQTFPLPTTRRYPITAAYRHRRPLFFGSIALAEAEFPSLLPIWTAEHSQAFTTLPIASDDAVIGSVGWTFQRPQAFDGGQRLLLERTSADCYPLLSGY